VTERDQRRFSSDVCELLVSSGLLPGLSEPVSLRSALELLCVPELLVPTPLVVVRWSDAPEAESRVFVVRSPQLIKRTLMMTAQQNVFACISLPCMSTTSRHDKSHGVQGKAASHLLLGRTFAACARERCNGDSCEGMTKPTAQRVVTTSRFDHRGVDVIGLML
jgi:hypothetical protein